MKVKRTLRVFAGSLLILLLAVAALDLLSVFGFVFTMTNADVANPDIAAWLRGGPYCFLPALVLGLLFVTVPRIPALRTTRSTANLLVLLPIAWLVYGAITFALVELSKNSFRAAGSLHLRNIVEFSIAEVLAAICLWIVRFQPNRNTSENL
jgi:hypothetical protein